MNQRNKSTVAVLTAGLMASWGGGRSSSMYLFPCRANTGGPVLILHKSTTLSGTGWQSNESSAPALQQTVWGTRRRLGRYTHWLHTQTYSHACKNTQARQRYVINSALVKTNREMTGLITWQLWTLFLTWRRFTIQINSLRVWHKNDEFFIYYFRSFWAFFDSDSQEQTGIDGGDHKHKLNLNDHHSSTTKPHIKYYYIKSATYRYHTDYRPILKSFYIYLFQLIQVFKLCMYPIFTFRFPLKGSCDAFECLVYNVSVCGCIRSAKLQCS